MTTSILPIDPSLLWCFQAGVGAGVIIVTTLSFFPGKPLGIQYGNSETVFYEEETQQQKQQQVDDPNVVVVTPKSSSSSSNNNNSDNKDDNQQSTTINDNIKSAEQQNSSSVEPETKDNDTNNRLSPFDTLSRSTLEQIQRQYQWSDEQMKHVLDTYREQHQEQLSSPTTAPATATGSQQHQQQSAWTPYQKLNFMVYVVMISVMIYVLNHEYGNLITVTMKQIFPKEAKLMGLM